MNGIIYGIVLVVGIPVYLYLLARIITSGITRSYLETKREFLKKEV